MGATRDSLGRRGATVMKEKDRVLVVELVIGVVSGVVLGSFLKRSRMTDGSGTAASGGRDPTGDGEVVMSPWLHKRSTTSA